ncbi:hypothetical protein L218DRAFT_913882 [Marasmius fiardii PR-910]|nr:hypothetical protein L218DRAFT_913882 [Marasmius fiardii PR-910]
MSASFSDPDAGPSQLPISTPQITSKNHSHLRFSSDLGRRTSRTKNLKSFGNDPLRMEESFLTSFGRRPPDGSGGRSSGRRVVLIDAKGGSSYISNPSGHRRRIHSLSSSPYYPPAKSHMIQKSEDDESNLFSDEYDLSQEDSRILQDVERAVKMKARREARLKAGKSPSNRASLTSSPSQTSSSPSRLLSAIPGSPTSIAFPSNGSPPVDIDFSPSTEPTTHSAPVVLLGPKKVPNHPVPWSSDDGSTLDWSGMHEDDKSERRWTLSISKSKGKDKDQLTSFTPIEKQESLYSRKLSRIKTLTSQRTLQKAAITSDQLQRRYQLTYAALSSGSKRYNLPMVARWFDGQDKIVQSALTKAEPLTWLKHLERKDPSSKRSGWHLSALIMEEFLQAQNASDTMAIIPEDPSLASPDLPSHHHSVLSFPSPSLASSRFSGHPLSGHISSEGRISFEPFVESGRQSLESRKSVDSAPSSILSGGSPNRSIKVLDISSPVASAQHLLDGTRHHPGSGSERAASPRTSLHDHSDDNDHKTKRQSLQAGDTIERQRSQGSSHISLSGDEPRVQRMSLKDGIRLQLSPTFQSPHRPSSLKSEKAMKSPSDMLSNRPKVRISLPPSVRDSEERDRLREEEQDDIKADHEYRLKSELLEQCRAQNLRVRGLLNRIATGVKEYETCQACLLTFLDLPHTGLPQELLEAFMHDPAAVTGHTGRFRGYKAVDDIHVRLARQRAIFQAFLQQDAGEGGLPVTHDVLQDPIAALMESIAKLEVHRIDIAERNEEVMKILEETQPMHNQVKDDYQRTVGYTSVIYPEISQIQVLEESYKDHYQHFWELGMNSLTFILDIVAPFWRTYGRTIGVDVQDFLIIPLYRNEFTGEAKRYPITHVPKRSVHHWVALGLFFCGCAFATLLQAYFGLSLLAHYRLQHITYVRWVILPIFWGAILGQWIMVCISTCIILLQVATVCWWLGWYIGLFT